MAGKNPKYKGSFCAAIVKLYIFGSSYAQKSKNPGSMRSHIKAFAVIILSAALFYACKDEDPTIAEITVVTPAGSRVEGAEVRIYGQGTRPVDDTTTVGDIRIDETRYTGSNGIVSFDFSNLYEPGQSGFAILDVDIIKEFPDSTSGVQGLMKIEEEKVNRKTFVLE